MNNYKQGIFASSSKLKSNITKSKRVNDLLNKISLLENNELRLIVKKLDLQKYPTDTAKISILQDAVSKFLKAKNELNKKKAI